MSTVRTLRQIVSDYITVHDLAETTCDHYHATAAYFRSWHRREITEDEFTPELVSAFLLAKQRDGCSSHYRQSLRRVLVTFLRYCGKTGKVRNVRLEPLEPVAWTPEEVQRLIAAVDGCMRHRHFWRVVIQVGYYTGLNARDIFRLDRSAIDGAGILRTKRGKTSAKVMAQIPPDLLSMLPSRGKICPWKYSATNFQTVFSRIVKRAGLTGSFKTLRKSAGTQAEKLHPGCGHILLANSRAVFEKHYMNREQTIPIQPTPLPRPDRPDPPRAA